MRMTPIMADITLMYWKSWSSCTASTYPIRLPTHHLTYRLIHYLTRQQAPHTNNCAARSMSDSSTGTYKYMMLCRTDPRSFRKLTWSGARWQLCGGMLDCKINKWMAYSWRRYARSIYLSWHPISLLTPPEG